MKLLHGVLAEHGQNVVCGRGGAWRAHALCVCSIATTAQQHGLRLPSPLSLLMWLDYRTIHPLAAPSVLFCQPSFLTNETSPRSGGQLYRGISHSSGVRLPLQHLHMEGMDLGQPPLAMLSALLPPLSSLIHSAANQQAQSAPKLSQHHTSISIQGLGTPLLTSRRV